MLPASFAASAILEYYGHKLVINGGERFLVGAFNLRSNGFKRLGNLSW